METYGYTFEDIFHAALEYNKTYRKIGRNDICLCGSENKYKKCCLSKYSYFGIQKMANEFLRNETHTLEDAEYYCTVHRIREWNHTYGFDYVSHKI